MASKRSYPDSDNSPEPATKRSKNQSNKARQHQNSHIDPTWGQKYVFGNHDGATTVPVDPELDFEDDGDAMAYLKSVRQEANGIPHLLVAPRIPIGPQLPTGFQPPTGDEELEEGEEQESEPYVDRGLYDRGTGDFRGRYVDGAYIGAPDSWDDDPDHDDADPDWDPDAEHEDDAASDAAIHEAYYMSLLSHYSALRALLHTRPPQAAVLALPRTQSPFVGQFGPRSTAFKVWDHRLRTADPSPVQVASMDKDSVLRVLRVLLSGSFLRRGGELAERTSRWVWALLARLPDRGELNHVEMSWIRDLGRRAVLMNQSLADMANLREALEGDLGVHDAIDDSSDDEAVLEDMEVDENDGEVVVDAGESGEASATQHGEAQYHEEDEGVGDDGAEPGENNGKTEEATATDLPKQTEEPAAAAGVSETKVNDAQSEAMDCSEDGEVFEGEAPRESVAPEAEEPESLEAMRARILAQLDTVEVQAAKEEAAERKAADDRLGARMNMRATLNMILTVAGDFYGQRDLLEFRDPFTGI